MSEKQPASPAHEDGDANKQIPRQPILAPAAPLQLKCPHNLFTISEIAQALHLLSEGVAKYRSTTVQVSWKNGATDYHTLEEFSRVVEVEEVKSVFALWSYSDRSQVMATLVRRPQAGTLSIEGAGQALEAAHSCRDYLYGLRTQRAKVRQFFAGWGLYFLFLFVLVVWLLPMLREAFAQWSDVVVSATTTSGTEWSSIIFQSLLSGLAITAIMTGIQRVFGGTRVARKYSVDHSWFTPAVGVAFTVAAFLVSLFSLLTR